MPTKHRARLARRVLNGKVPTPPPEFSSDMSHLPPNPLREVLIDDCEGFLFLDHIIPFISVRNLLDDVYFTCKRIALLIQEQDHHVICVNLYKVIFTTPISKRSMLLHARGIKFITSWWDTYNFTPSDLSLLLRYCPKYDRIGSWIFIMTLDQIFDPISRKCV